MAAIILLVLKATIVLSVFAIGLNTTFANATFLFRRPNQLARALLAKHLVMPLLALGLMVFFNLHPAIEIALLGLSVSPIPPIFPNRAVKIGGAGDYTMGLLVASAALSLIVIPLAMEIFERILGIPLQMRARSVAWVVFITTFLPLAMGIAVGALAPKLAGRLAKPIALFALVLLLLCLLPVLFVLTRPMVSLIGDGTLLSIVVFATVGFVAGHLLGGPEHANRPTLALATATRHPAVAASIAVANFPNERLVVPAVFLYLIVTVALSAVYLAWAKRQEILPPAKTKRPVAA